MRVRATALAALLLAAFFAAPARADEGEIVIFETNTKYVEVDVRIDRRLAAFPKLYRQLVAEGKKFGADSRNDTLAQWREDRSLFRNPYSFSRVYGLRAAAGKYVSVIVSESEYTGGAHPNHGSTTLLWDRDRNEKAEFATLFKDTKNGSPDMLALSKLVKDALFAEKKRRDIPASDDDPWFKDWKPEFPSFGQPALAPSTEAGKSSGVTFHFSPYDVGAYVEGYYTAFVPASALLPLLTPDAQKLFGGERPKSDGKQE